MKKIPNYVWAIVGIILLIGIIALSKRSDSSKGIFPSNKNLASCIKEKGFHFYGASWCHHCQEQKRIFGDSATLLPSVECSINGTRNQTQECNNAGISGYPTWVLPDGTKRSGEISLAKLKQISGC